MVSWLIQALVNESSVNRAKYDAGGNLHCILIISGEATNFVPSPHNHKSLDKLMV